MIENLSVLLFNQDRNIYVYLPKNYETENKCYPVLYMHDGKNVFRDEDAIGGISLCMESYLDQHELEVIVVAIEAGLSDNRIIEYCPWNHGEFAENLLGKKVTLVGKGKDYVDFIVNELKPTIDQKYRTLKHRTYMAGISLGGLVSTYAVCKYPTVFSRIAAISSGYYRNQEKIEEFCRRSSFDLVEKFYFVYGLKEGSEGLVRQGFIHSNQSIYEIISSKTKNIKLTIVEDGEHHYTHFRKRVPEIFSYLLSD